MAEDTASSSGGK